MTAHDWRLRAVGQAAEGRTRFEWRCAQCLSDTFTNSRGHHDGAEENRPGRRALQGAWVDEDCATALVTAVSAL